MQWQQQRAWMICISSVLIVAAFIVSGQPWALYAETVTDETERNTASISLALPDITVFEGEQAAMPVTAHPNGDVFYGIDLVIAYDSAIAEPVAITRGSLLPASWVVSQNTSTAGIIYIGVAGSTPVTTNGELVVITFDARGSSGSITTVTFTRSDVNEVPVTHQDGVLRIIAPTATPTPTNTDIPSTDTPTQTSTPIATNTPGMSRTTATITPEETETLIAWTPSATGTPPGNPASATATPMTPTSVLTDIPSITATTSGSTSETTHTSTATTSTTQEPTSTPTTISGTTDDDVPHIYLPLICR